MKSSARKVELASVDDLFSTEESRQDAAREKVMDIPLTELFPFEGHPFSVRDDDAMKEAVESVKEYGVLYEKRDEIREQIDYDLIADSSNREQLNEFMEIMLEVALSRSPTMKIGRDAEYPTALAQQRFEQINSEHILRVLDGIRENTTLVRNTRAYLLASLFNAPATTDNHYTMLVNHDMNAGG